MADFGDDSVLEVFVPTFESDGECFHATSCGGHNLKPLPIDDAKKHIQREELKPCRNCIRHHGLNEILYALRDRGLEFPDWR